MECARHEAAMRQTQGDATVRSHLQAAARSNNPASAQRAMDALSGPEVPETLVYLWDIFRELELGRRYGMNGAEPLSYTDIQAYAWSMGREIEPREVLALLQLDATVRSGKPVDPKAN